MTLRTAQSSCCAGKMGRRGFQPREGGFGGIKNAKPLTERESGTRLKRAVRQSQRPGTGPARRTGHASRAPAEDRKSVV